MATQAKQDTVLYTRDSDPMAAAWRIVEQRGLKSKPTSCRGWHCGANGNPIGPRVCLRDNEGNTLVIVSDRAGSGNDREFYV